jgi:hypothetical protein
MRLLRPRSCDQTRLLSRALREDTEEPSDIQNTMTRLPETVLYAG